MQGIIFNLLGDRVSEAWGEDYWTDLIRKTAGLENPVFVGPKNYPDAALLALVGAIGRDRNISTPDLLRDFGRWAFPKLAASHPVFLKGHSRARDFLKTVEAVVHTEVRKMYDDAYLPKISLAEVDDRTFILTYESHRKLCWLAEGLVLGVAEYFNESLAVAQDACVHQGAPACRIRATLQGAKT